MKRSLDLTPEQRTSLLDLYRGCPDPDVRFRSHVLIDDNYFSRPAIIKSPGA